MDPKHPTSLDVTCQHALSFPNATGTYTDANGAPRTYVTDSSNGGYAIYPVLSKNVWLYRLSSPRKGFRPRNFRAAGSKRLFGIWLFGN